MPEKLDFLYSLFRKITILGLLLFQVSCGLKYIPTETPYEFEQKRHQAVESYILKDLGSANLKYESVAFAETLIVKPDSFKALDSLHAIKYENELRGINDDVLNEKIESQRMIALNDTNKVIYIEEHIFALGEGDTVSFYSALFQMEKDLIIDDMKIEESVFLPKRYQETYKQYLFEESVLTPEYLPSGDELNFYHFYKSPLSTMTSSAKDDFILHTLKLMELAKTNRTFSTATLLKAQITKQFVGNSYIKVNEEFSEIFEETAINEQNVNVVIGYNLTYSISSKDESNSKKTYHIEFDEYLRIKKIIQL